VPSHGALSKAGKVRSITPKMESTKRSSSIPRVGNRKLYYKRFILDRNVGQYKPDNRRRRRRR
jgi:small subunit ribosomal protein S30e